MAQNVHQMHQIQTEELRNFPIILYVTLCSINVSETTHLKKIGLTDQQSSSL